MIYHLTTNTKMLKDEIFDIGCFFDLDENGFLINPSSKDKFQDEWVPVVNELLDFFKKKYSAYIEHIFLRGSVARGTAVKNKSNINIVVVVDDNCSQFIEKDEEIPNIKKLILNKFNFVYDVDLIFIPLKNVNENLWSLFIDAVPIYTVGKDFRLITNTKIDLDLLTHLNKLENYGKMLNDFDFEKLKKKEICKICKCTMKILICSGMNLTLSRELKYSKDLFPCFSVFCKYYPEKKEEMEMVFNLFIDPINDPTKIKEISNTLGAWIVKEFKNNDKITKFD